MVVILRRACNSKHESSNLKHLALGDQRANRHERVELFL